MKAKIPARNQNTARQAPTLPKSGDARLKMWLSKLPAHVMAVNADAIRAVMREINDEDSTADKLAVLIQQEPILCLKLYLKASRQLQKRDGTIQGIIHLIGLLGTEQIKQTLRETPKQKTTSSGQQELFSASLFAAELACHLLPKKHGIRSERFYLPSLLFNAPLWLMWSAAPKVMAHGQTYASKKQQALKPLCQKTLGFSLQSLLEKTRAFLPLPELTLKALAIDFQKNSTLWRKARRLSHEEASKWAKSDKKIKQALFSPEVGITLVNHYVLALYLDWNGKHIKRWGALLANHLGLPLESLEKTVITIASQMHSKADEPSNLYLSGQLSPLYRYRQLHKALPADEPSGNAAIIQHYLGQLRNTTQSGSCLQLAMEALSEGVQAEHCIMLRISHKQIHIPLAYGFKRSDKEGECEPESIKFAIDDCGVLFSKLLKKPMSIAVEPAQLSRLKSQLPSALTRFWRPKPCGLMSLFHNGQPYAIVICDHAHWDEKHQQAFKQVGKTLTHSLKQCEV